VSSAAVYLTGATASGKSALALHLAKRMGGEIISVDSMQVYCGLDIGTAKPSAEEQAEVPHHLIDVATLDEAFDAAQFVRLAKRAEATVRARGNRPIFCGGTGLYFRALLEGLGESPPSDNALSETLAAMPLETLVDELKSRDPQAAAQVDLQNPRRVVRAVEVIRLTGRPYSEQRTGWNKTGQAAGNLFCVQRKVETLNQRIHARVDVMFEQGLVEETKHLAKLGLRENRNARQALGYRQVLELLDGSLGLENMIELVKTKTRQFAKRQRSWFRNQMTCETVEWAAGEPVDACCDRLLGRIS
jgi:tRNA dimethylallyltransferase